MGLAPAHLDADGAGAAPAARAGGDPRLGDPAERRRLAQDLPLAGRPPRPDADLRAARAVLGLRLGLVRGHLHAADGLAGRLHHPAALRLLAGAAGAAAGRPAVPLPAARAHVVRRRPRARRRAGRRADGAEGPRLPRARGRRLGRGRARLPPRGGQPAVPPGRRGRAGGLRGRRAVRLQGRRDPRGRQRLLQQPHAVRRLRPGLAVRPRLDGAVQLHGRRLRRRVDRLGAAAGDGAAASTPT